MDMKRLEHDARRGDVDAGDALRKELERRGDLDAYLDRIYDSLQHRALASTAVLHLTVRRGLNRSTARHYSEEMRTVGFLRRARREELRGWLRDNDPNGEYDDDPTDPGATSWQALRGLALQQALG